MTAVDITVYETAFQGRALEPITGLGRSWTKLFNDTFDRLAPGERIIDPDFDRDTIQADVRCFDDLFDEASRLGLVLATASGGIIVQRGAQNS